MGPIGHAAIGIALKPAAPKVPLWILLAASEVLDLLCFGFFGLGIERNGVSKTDLIHGLQVISPGSIPWSHGLFTSIVWSMIAAGLAFIVTRNQSISSIIGLVIFSHWFLDFIVHPGELPLFLGGSPTVGLGLWTSGPGLILSGILEVTLFVAGLILYLRFRGVPFNKWGFKKGGNQ